jgi:hypothetical protein
MLRTIGGQQVYLTVISAGRPENVQPMSKMIGAATWYVPEDQKESYRVQGAPFLKKGSDSGVVPVRNRALQEGWARGAISVQLDDDLKWAAFVSNGKAQRIPPSRALELLVKRLAESDFKFGGAAPTNNAYFTRRQNSTNLFIRSGVIAVKPTTLLMDDKLPVKFDYDYTLQHIQTYGGVLRCDDLIFDFQQRTNKGGHVDTRSDAVEQFAIAYLQKKWGSLVRLNPKRKNEILLNVPRRKREVLV